jgi:6-pyruvoyltetrahydropterin/6-carboxytetrahydropterin synthase
MYRIVKRIDFCYGHRLLDYAGKCRNLHGHNGRVELEIAGRDLDARDMLADFGDVKRAVKEWIDANLDHRMILRRDDPTLACLRGAGEPVYVMDENPTAEAIAKLIYEQARASGLPVRSVRLWETSSSSAIYEPEA